MANTGFLSTTELDFETIKSNLKTYLKAQDRFADYDFEGSNINVLLDLLSYNTYLNSFYLNMVGSEMFLDTAQLRESAVSHAKELNYVPRSKTSAVAYVDITVNTGNTTPAFITIPKNYKFTTIVDSTTLTFSVPSDVIIRPIGGVYTASNTAIYEGSLVTEYFTVANTSEFYTINSENIDTTSLTVTVYESNTSTIPNIYTQATSLFDLTPTSNVYFVQGFSTNKYQVYFGNDLTGRALSVGNLVKVEYRDTLGELGNGAYSFYKTSSINGYSDISITTNFVASEGSDRESIDSIKFNAPRYFPTQERAVTAQDYIALTKAQFPQLQAVNAYGGEDLSPPQYGKVAISVKPYGTTGLISNALKTNIIDYLAGKNLTTEPIIVDPEFFYIDVDTTINYDTRLTSKSILDIKTLAENAILSYGNTNLTEFGSDLRYSKLVSEIDAVDASVVSNETTLKLIKRWSPLTGSLNTETFSFDNELYHELTLYQLPDNHEQTLYTTSFTYTHSDGLDYNCYIGDDGLGNLRVYNLQNVGGVTTRVVLNSDAGTVNYYTGEILIKLNPTSYSGSYISIYGVPLNKDIYAIKNKFLLIEAVDVLVTVNRI